MASKKQKAPIVIGLTGGIGMGKSTAAKLLLSMGFPIYSADQSIHDIMKKGGKAVAPVATLFPLSLKNGEISRELLGREVFKDPRKLRKLEAILHPLIRKAEQDFLKKAAKKNAFAAILEIPLLFETKGEGRFDKIICVTASKAVQKKRVLERKQMTGPKLKAILDRQLPDVFKREKADYIVRTDLGLAHTRKHLRKIMDELLAF